MDVILLAARLLLSGVFLVSGVAKLADRPGSRRALEAFGVPAALAGPGAVVLPLVELVVSIALLPASTAWLGSVGAAALLAVFSVGIGINVARGRSPECHCFGQLTSSTASPRTLARNIALLAVAGSVALQGPAGAGPGAVEWVASAGLPTQVALVIGAAILLVLARLGWLVIELLAQQGRLLLRIEALEAAAAAAGTPGTQQHSPARRQAPDFRLERVDGEPATIHSLLAPGRPVVLTFLDPGCGACDALVPDLVGWQRDHAERLSVIVVARGSADANRQKLGSTGLTVLLQRDREVSEAYGTGGTPSAVLIDPDGRVAERPADGPEAIRALVRRALARPVAAPVATRSRPPRPPTPLGSPLPEVTLTDLEGRPARLTDHIRGRTMVLFWDPGCGFCARMREELKEIELDPPAGAPSLVVIGKASREAHAAEGFRSPVLVDSDGTAAAALRLSGTPTAFLVDAERRVASTVVGGGPAVLALARGEPPPRSA